MQHYGIGRGNLHENPFLLCVSPPIRQALPSDAFERVICALCVSHAKCGAIVVSEIELGDIALKMLLANMVIRPDQTALQDVEEGFRRVCVNVAAHVFALPVRDGRMSAEFIANGYVSAGFISHKMRFRSNLAAQDRRESLGIDVQNVKTACLTV